MYFLFYVVIFQTSRTLHGQFKQLTFKLYDSKSCVEFMRTREKKSFVSDLSNIQNGFLILNE